MALESGPFGKVVGCTHSHNQTVFGRQLLSEFGASKWELHEADYREDSRVFDHVASTGMVSHVGPRGLVPYVRNVRQRIRSGGRYLHHALMSVHSSRPLDSAPGIAFNKKYVWPGFHWFTFGDHVKALEQSGFQVLRAVNLSPHYAKTAGCLVRALAPARRGHPGPREPGDVPGMADLFGRVLGSIHEPALARVSPLLRGGLSDPRASTLPVTLSEARHHTLQVFGMRRSPPHSVCSDPGCKYCVHPRFTGALHAGHRRPQLTDTLPE